MAAGAAAAAHCGISPLAAQSKTSLTAQQLIDRIHQHAGAGWPRNASAGLKAGSPDTPVRGIVIHINGHSRSASASRQVWRKPDLYL
jgi:hypothetical protein